MRDTYQHLHFVLHGTHQGSVQQVGIGEGEEYQEFNDKATVERLIIENNTKQFCLMENMLALQEPLLLELGYLGDTEAARRILAGTYVCPPGVDEYTCDFLTCLQWSPHIPDLQIRTTIM